MEMTKRIATLQRIRKLSRLMDSAFGIPGTKFRIGLDPIMGLVPGLGDLVGAAFSGYIILLAVQLGIPGSDIRKMIFNAGIETVIGEIPLIGDLFDAYYKANLRNVAILEEYLTQADPDLENAAPPADEEIKQYAAN